MGERRQNPRLALEPRQPALVRRKRRREELDRHLAAEHRVHCLPHDAHSALTDALNEAVVEEREAGSEVQSPILLAVARVGEASEIRAGLGWTPYSLLRAIGGGNP